MLKNDVTYIKPDLLEDFMQAVLIKTGVPKEDASIIADVLISSDKRGIDSHGIGRFKPIYIDRLEQGIMNPITRIDVIKNTFTTAVLDANNGMGHVVSKKAMAMAIDKAKQYGMGMVVVKDSSHYGFAGYYPLMATKEGLIGITGTNARPSIAPTFGVDNMLGTNPLTFGIPTDEEFDFVLDCATSTTQRGKIEQYAREEKILPSGWVIDRDGKTQTDPKKVLGDLVDGNAALTPLGGIGEETSGHKGYGYATVVEILSSALQTGPFLTALSGYNDDGKAVPYRLGHFFVAINIENFVPLGQFKKTTGDILRQLRNSTTAPGCDRIYTAGEKEYIAWQERKEKGIPVGSTVLNKLIELRDRYGLDEFEFITTEM